VFDDSHPPAGSRPGTLAIPEGSPAPRIFLFEYDREELREFAASDVEELAPYAESESVTWIDVQGLGDERVLRRIAELFGIHPLALEDAVNVPQSAKSHLYPQHHLVIARAPLRGDDGRLGVPQVCLLVGRNYLITFQERYFGFFDPVRERIRAGIGPIRESGPDYLAWALIDTMVDLYFPVVDQLSQSMDALEDEMVRDPAHELLGELHRLRREVAVLRRVGWPQRETLGLLCRDPSPFIGEQSRVFLRDTSDHVSQIMGRVDFCREISVGLMDMYLSTLSHRTNEVMKVLTLMASIFIPLTFIAGIYGMNFEHMPELHSQRAYPLVLLLMCVLALGMLAYFRWRGWLGGRRRRPRDPD
jgi:magnesium transporter